MKKQRPVRSKKDFLVFGAPLIEKREMREVTQCLQTGWLGTGPKVARFEKEFAAYKGGRHAVAVNSCTAALHLSLLAAGLRPGDEVITTPLTFCATVNAIIHSGATPVLADVDPLTLNINPEEVARKITPRTRAILPVHFAGRPCEMDHLQHLAKKNALFLIEDCAHALESTFRGKSVGLFGDFGCFSFYVTKNVVTGEGGMVLSPWADAAAKIKTLALHGMSQDAWSRFSDKGYKHYRVTELGFKYNMMDLQAALGIHQLGRVERNLKVRERIWNQYTDAFQNLPLTLPPPPAPQTKHARHLYTIQIEKATAGMTRDNFLGKMTEQNIGVGVHYLSLPEHPFYQERLGWRPEDTPHATTIGRQIVSLPLSARLSEKDVKDVIKAVKRVLMS